MLLAIRRALAHASFMIAERLNLPLEKNSAFNSALPAFLCLANLSIAMVLSPSRFAPLLSSCVDNTSRFGTNQEDFKMMFDFVTYTSF